MWTISKVSLDEGADFDAFINEERWNGFLCPYFTIKEAEKVVNYINSQNEYPDAIALVMDKEGRKVYENMPNGQIWEFVQITGFTLVQIGGYSYAWEFSE